MKIHVAFTSSERGPLSTAGHTSVVLDVLRATSTIVHALVNGAPRVIPVASVEDAVKRKEEIGRDASLLCGERDALPIPGFDLGNSPEEFTTEAVDGRALIMTTTNGTPALLSTAGSAATLVGSLLNVGAVARHVIALGNDVLIVCAGREGRFALEDACAAGVLAERIAATRRVRLDDGGRAAVTLAGRYGRNLELALKRSAAGRALSRLGRGRDVTFCAQLDLHDVVPVYENYRIELS